MSHPTIKTAGDFFHTHIAQVLPPWLTTVLLAALLALLAGKLVHRGVLTFRSETKALAAQAAEDAERAALLEAPLLQDGACHCCGVTAVHSHTCSACVLSGSERLRHVKCDSRQPHECYDSGLHAWDYAPSLI